MTIVCASSTPWMRHEWGHEHLWLDARGLDLGELPTLGARSTESEQLLDDPA